MNSEPIQRAVVRRIAKQPASEEGKEESQEIVEVEFSRYFINGVEVWYLRRDKKKKR